MPPTEGKQTVPWEGRQLPLSPLCLTWSPGTSSWTLGEQSSLGLTCDSLVGAISLKQRWHCIAPSLCPPPRTHFSHHLWSSICPEQSISSSFITGLVKQRLLENGGDPSWWVMLGCRSSAPFYYGCEGYTAWQLKSITTLSSLPRAYPCWTYPPSPALSKTFLIHSFSTLWPCTE